MEVVPTAVGLIPAYGAEYLEKQVFLIAVAEGLGHSLKGTAQAVMRGQGAGLCLLAVLPSRGDAGYGGDFGAGPSHWGILPLLCPVEEECQPILLDPIKFKETPLSNSPNGCLGPWADARGAVLAQLRHRHGKPRKGIAGCS